MKKRALSILSICTLGLSGVANATLIDQNDGMILDDVTGIYWYQNLNDFKDMTYAQQLSTIGNLTTGGFSWHLATSDDMDTLLDNVGQQNVYGSYMAPEASQITENFTPTGSLYTTTSFLGIWDEPYYSNTDDYNKVLEVQTRPATESYVNDDIDNYYFINNTSYSADGNYASSDTGAWVATDAIYTPPGNPVPEPATMMLFGIGLLGLAGVKRRKNSFNSST